MSKFRHSSSFMISGSIYALLVFLYITLLATPQKTVAKKESVVKIAIITPPTPVKIEPKPVVIPPKPVIVPPKPKPKKKIKPKPKKKIKPKPKPKLKPKAKKKPTPKKIRPKPKPVVEEIYEEPIIEEVYQEPIREVAPVVVKPTTPVAVAPKVDLSAHKQRFKDKVRTNIITNKRYPRMAKRRRIEGTVHVVFDIGSDGTVSNIRTSGASNLLQKAVRRSIQKSFPANIPNIIIGEFPMRNVSTNVDFILE